MATEADSRGRGKRIVAAAKVAPILLFFPIIPIAVGLNLFHAADRLSSLPGIRTGGGVVSGVAAATMIIAGIGVVVGGFLIATGAGVPVTGGENEPASPATSNTTQTPTSSPTPTISPTPTATATTTPTPTVTPTTTPTPGPTSTPTPVESLDDDPNFKEFDRVFHRNNSAASEEVVDTPILATKFRRGSNGSVEYWVVFDEIEPTTQEEASDMRTQWANVAITYAVSVGKHDGRDPDRLVAVGLNDEFNNTHYTVPTSKALQAWRGEMNSSQYLEVWWNRMSGHPDDDEISQIAMRMVRGPEGERTPVDSRDQ